MAAVLDWASGANVAVIPFGCGSSVVGGVEPAVGDRYAGAISLDLRRLDRVLEVDGTSRAARIQAGILGPAIEAALKPHGLAIRHYPQSFEFSTLGGWIATRSGGHFATLYTHIDDFVESLRTVTPAGVLEIAPPARLGRRAESRPHDHRLGRRARRDHRGVDAAAGPADASGAAPCSAFPTSSRPPRPCAPSARPGSTLPICASSTTTRRASTASTITRKPCSILGFEFADHPVEAWMARAVELIQDHGGRRHPDESAALRWRTAFIRMPYARELTVPLGVINDTFESAVTWDRFEAFHAAVSAATEEALEEATGRAGLSTRFTHVYPDGPAPYYTFNARGTPGRLLEQWRHIKTRASDALLAAGGTITHHHAVGRDHMPWYREQRPALFGTALAAAKGARPGRDPQPGRPGRRPDRRSARRTSQVATPPPPAWTPGRADPEYHLRRAPARARRPCPETGGLLVRWIEHRRRLADHLLRRRRRWR